MTIMKRLISLLFALSLAACGGGGGTAGTSPFGGGTETPGDTPVSTALTIDVLANAIEAGSGGDPITISAIVKGVGNTSLPSTAVSFSADSGNLTAVAATTDAAGVAIATLTAGADKSNRLITVTVTSGTARGSVQVAVIGTSLTFSGDTTIPLNSVRQLTVAATDSNGAVIPQLSVAMTSNLGNGLSSAQLRTGSQGTAPFTYTANRSGTDQLTFSGGGATTTARIEVSGEDFVFVSPAANQTIPVGTLQTVTVRYLSGNEPRAGRTVNFAATAGTILPSSAVTNASGEATATVSSTTSSPATIQATLIGGAAAQATLPVVFVATTPARLVLQVTPTAIGANAVGSTTHQAQLVATVVDAAGNPVAGQTVNFNRIVDPSGGNLSQASAGTNSSGQATVQYISGASTTASNGVQIVATVAGTAVSGTATLTVNQSALFIALGTGNVIQNVNPQVYQKDWVVYVTDSNGNPVGGVSLTMKAIPQSYGKGGLYFRGNTWRRALSTEPEADYECTNEDDSLDGIYAVSEDDNGNGTLEPGNVIAVSPRTLVTDASGLGTVSLIYAESYAPWVTIKLRAEAVVSGTESSKEAIFVVPGLAADFSSATVSPAGVVSPFGVNPCNTPN